MPQLVHDQGGTSMDAGTTHDHHAGPVTWAVAAQATLQCLTGCAIGELLG